MIYAQTNSSGRYAAATAATVAEKGPKVMRNVTTTERYDAEENGRRNLFAQKHINRTSMGPAPAARTAF